MNRLIRRAISTWQSYQTKRQLERTTSRLLRVPEMREFARKEQEACQKHSKVKPIRKARAVFMTEALRAK